MALRAISYGGARQGSVPAPAAMAERRMAMNARGSAVPSGVRLVPDPVGPGQSEWVQSEGLRRRGALLYLHGSGYSKGSPASHRPLVAAIVRESGMVAYALDYRLAPEHRFPAALEDALAAYRKLLGEVGAGALALVGDSAGGGLALATLLAAKEQGLAMPAAVATLSAWTDLAVTGDPRPDVGDPLVTQPMLREAAALYLDGADPRDPYASPLFGDLAGLPPLLMQVGGREIMVEDTSRFATRAKAAGVAVTQTVYPGMTHVFPLNQPEAFESSAAIAELARFLAGRIVRP
jgi:monoterpene epsilon-lactone hydrolase